MSKIKFLALFTAVITAVFVIGCSEDTTTNNQGGQGGNPNINMQVGAVYTMNVDSIQTNGNVTGTRLKTTHTYLSQGTFFGQSNVFQIRSVTQDSAGGPTLIDTFYVRYEGGKFYQYGIINLLDPNITPTWDLVADYTVAFGTQWTIAANVVTQFGTVNIRAKVAVDTTFHTYGYGNNPVNAYRSEITADIANIPFVYVDYFIGDADPATNPSGLVRLRLRPFLTFGGVDQKIQRWQ
ncbi:MAG: hypothetical protein L0Y79_07315 [Chlorobi bacterium]|nr:hypothetical protein [Chlorobiota bacterium]MCI0716864.1 hypothetical protein [Chlorobiota bacterium]